MRFGWQGLSHSRRYVPRCVAGLFACLIALDAVHSIREVHRLKSAAALQGSAVALRKQSLDVRPLLNAHLFGVSGHDVRARGDGPQRMDWVLTGVVATENPQDGYAILGGKDKSGRLYHTGEEVPGLSSAKLYRVFDDRVVLDLGGPRETIYLTHIRTLGKADSEVVAASVVDETPAAASDFETPFHPASAAETLFGTLDAQERNVDGKFAGMQLHPAKHFQKLYGLREGDVVTAVNGVEITDSDSLSSALKSSDASLTLTFTRDGEEQTLSLPVPN